MSLHDLQIQNNTEPIIVGILILFAGYFLLKMRRWLKRYGQVKLLRRANSVKRLKKMRWDAFEELCMLLFQKEGWHVLGNEKKGADGGVDLWMKRRMKRAIVQCKRYDDAMVTIKVIREMYGLMHEYDVNEVYIVTSSRFTKECYRFSEGKPIVLIDGEKLVRMVRKYSG
jgi:HJR/Mrr/RecB family endonuclease